MTLPRLTVLFAALVLAAAGAGCGDDSTPTSPTPPPNAVTETFTGTISANGAASHAFVATGSGNVTLTLTSLTLESGGTPPVIGISLGGVSSIACTAVVSRDAARPGDVLTGSTGGGTLCARIYDAFGLVTDPVTYTLTVVHP